MSKGFELPAEANIYNIMEIRESLLAWVAEQDTRAQGPLEVSARDVAEIDGAGLQLLASLSSTAPGWRLAKQSSTSNRSCSRSCQPNFASMPITGLFCTAVISARP